MKYKVGDKVRVRKDLKSGRWYGAEKFVGSMEEYRGKVFEVKSIRKGMYHLTDCNMEFYHWNFTEEMLEPVSENKIVITTKGNEVTARLYDGKKVIKSATAKCSPDDEFDFDTGAKIAFERLTKPEEEKPKHYNGKVVCISSKWPNWFTVGKIYEIIDGQCVDDEGDKRPTHGAVETLREFNDIMEVEFVELVED